ncbi:DoxX family protein [Aequorivita capsosiphonis]|uniref:DoxX family protein n=1 Tax=Aequorivita capsosiphonis TaxID=487317 RepID=UPI00041A3DF6|nr:DoxX family protein [Aequorivita capsosiphonis]
MKKATNFLIREYTTAHDIGLLILRLVFAFVLLYGHGYGKMNVILSGQEIQFMDPIGIGMEVSFYLAAFAEGICAILLILGLFSRIASLILTINFVVIFIFHAYILGDTFEILELRYLYFFAFLALTFTGPGKFSLDYMFFSHTENKERIT